MASQEKEGRWRMLRKEGILRALIVACITMLWMGAVHGEGEAPKHIYPVGKLKPRDSITTLTIGDRAPDFTLPAVEGGSVCLSQYLGKKNVVLSFVPAAWTPVCTYQWPVYDLAKDIFDDNEAVLLGITVDNIPSLYAWTRAMANDHDGLWFPVLSDFHPYGRVSEAYGVLRSEGFSERALFVVDKTGVIRFIDVHDINERPPLMALREALENLNP
jgi:peroxiredoxin (alkyl hydroperoxide reductase subunit C)